MWFNSLRTILEVSSFIAIIATLFFGLYTYLSDSKEKAYRESEEVYRIGNASYFDFLKLAIQYPNLDLYSVKAPPEQQATLSQTDKDRQKQLYCFLIDLLEVAYVHYFNTEGIPKDLKKKMLEKQWPGWEAYIKKYLGTSTISEVDIIDLKSFANKLKQPSKDDSVSAYIVSKLSEGNRTLMTKYSAGSDTNLLDALVKDLNQIIEHEIIYDPQRFANVKLSPETAILLDRLQETDVARARLNRLLLQDAYPLELSDQFVGRLAFRETWFEVRNEYDQTFVNYMDQISPPDVGIPRRASCSPPGQMDGLPYGASAR